MRETPGQPTENYTENEMFLTALNYGNTDAWIHYH